MAFFEEYATGAYTLSEIATKAKEWGLRSKKGMYLQKSVIHRLVQHQFYYGEMEIKGEMFAHRHETLIPQWLFQKCQVVRLGHHKKPFKYAEKEYIFRGLLTCAVKGRVVTADTKIRKHENGTTSEWTYLRCWKSENPEKQMWVREEKVIKQVEDLLARIGIRNKEFLNDTIAYIKETTQLKKEHHSVEVGQLKKEHTEIQSKLDRLMDLRLEAHLTQGISLTIC